MHKIPGANPLIFDNWIKRKICLGKNHELKRENIEKYQLNKLKETIVYAKENSKFYRTHLECIDKKDIHDLDDISKLPFTTSEHIKDQGKEMICVSQSRISRIVTLDTSGSTGKPKRIYFTEDDQELTIDYFDFGMRVMTGPDDKFLVLLPCKTPGSVGDLLRLGLERNNVKVIPYGYPNPDESQDQEIIDLIRNEEITSLVGTTTVISRLARKSAKEIKTLETVLLSAEYVGQDSVDLIENLWKCKVFEHFGMTETGLGGAMACSAHVGYHPREADLLFEIIDPKTGVVLPEGEYGELVFTTITRKGMPLLRYRTGDKTRWIPGKCPCGSVIKRLDRVGDRGVEKQVGY